MRLRFFGTKGYVDATSPSHAGHSAFTVEAGGFRLLCDFGESWKGRLAEIAPDAILISHGHPDHAWGLSSGADVPVFASEVTHALMADFPIARREKLAPEEAANAGPFRITAFPVVHSTRCPGIAARIETPDGILLYSGDVVGFETPDAGARALAGVDVYVGDGSSLTASLVRRHPSGVLLGHTTVRAQLGWVAKAQVPRAIFSHWGEEPIGMGDAALAEALDGLASAKTPGCDVSVAYDGKEFEIAV
jgi:ribonuclease BN (tRNA processing enzyme)